MDIFTVKCTPSDPHHFPKNITASDRAKMFPNEFHESGGKLFCTLCNVVVDHMRIFVIKQHRLTKRHLNRASASGTSVVKSDGVSLGVSHTVIPATPGPTPKTSVVQQCAEGSVSSKSSRTGPSKLPKQQTISNFRKQTDAAKTRYEVSLSNYITRKVRYYCLY